MMSNDAVPNVRFNVAKTLQALVGIVTPVALKTQLRPCLVKLANDKDVDVQYFAQQALKAIAE